MALVAWSQRDVVAKEVILLMERLVFSYNVERFLWGLPNLWGIPIALIFQMETAITIDTKTNLMYIAKKKF